MVKNSFYSLLTQLVFVLGRSSVVILIARVGGAELQGLYALSFLTITAFASVVTFGFDIANTYLLASQRPSDSQRDLVSVYFTGSFLVTSGLTGVLILLYLVFAQDFADSIGLPVGLVGVVILSLPIFGTNDSTIGIARGLSNFRSIFITETLKQLLFISLLLVAVVQNTLDITWIVVAWSLATLSGFVALWFSVGHPWPTSLDIQSIKKQVILGRWRFLQYMVLFLYTRLDLLIITALLGIREAGFYATAKFVVDSFRRIPGVFLGPLTVDVAEGGLRHATDYVYRLTLLLGVGFIGLIVLTSDWIVPAVFGADFRPSIQPLQILVFAGVVQALVELTNHSLYGLGRTFAPFVAMVVAIAIIGGAGFLLVPIYGVSGASWATLAGNCIALILLIRYLGRETNLTSPQLVRSWIPQIGDFQLVLALAQRFSRKAKKSRSSLYSK